MTSIFSDVTQKIFPGELENYRIGATQKQILINSSNLMLKIAFIICIMFLFVEMNRISRIVTTNTETKTILRTPSRTDKLEI